MLLGRRSESPYLGPGGVVTQLSSPSATAAGLARLLTDREFYLQCSRAMRERVRRYYHQSLVNRTYRELYESYRNRGPLPAVEEDKATWPASDLNFAS
jgi:glycosyltransferase involved in cell wall biosynthesis